MSPIGPEFGASLGDTPKYDSEQEAVAVRLCFPVAALCGSIVVPIDRSWTCPQCSRIKYEIWCWDCDIHESGKTLIELREEKAVRDLDRALSATCDYEKVSTPS
jgi:hypothetical protein